MNKQLLSLIGHRTSVLGTAPQAFPTILLTQTPEDVFRVLSEVVGGDDVLIDIVEKNNASRASRERQCLPGRL